MISDRVRHGSAKLIVKVSLVGLALIALLVFGRKLASGSSLFIPAAIGFLAFVVLLPDPSRGIYRGFDWENARLDGLRIGIPGLPEKPILCPRNESDRLASFIRDLTLHKRYQNLIDNMLKRFDL